MKWLQSQSQRAIQIALQSKALLKTPSKPLLLGSAAFLGFYTLFETIQRPILYRRNLFSQSGISPFGQDGRKLFERNNGSQSSLSWRKYANIRFYCPKPHGLHWSDFKRDNKGALFGPRQCDFCGSERFLHPSLRKEARPSPSPSVLKMTKGTASRKIVPALFKSRSALNYHFQQFLTLLPDAKNGRSPFHFVGIGKTSNFYPTKSVRFSKAQYLFYNASV
ncbi:uncharacterized protein FA14DRAFT_178434 [Meira miltonrushii]|uniref:Uncharacterized protein n=1 Tax=Meira miltonrushii TaxID=1280837 RepID=A0A316VBV9_9BASI|nr:uncharacterized protein FA14DRAFT_178434 [Meira miltonrushii]PWN35052.1 hypothetical protein FA14DRAFT_178434 [Meira miltonrushii]